jgi:integral membrane sensor domain MASE1
LTFRFFRSSMTSSCHQWLGFPTGLVPIGFQSSSFLVGLAWFILWICPSHLVLCALVNLTISAPTIKLSFSMLFCILHTLSTLTGPNTFLNTRVIQ